MKIVIKIRYEKEELIWLDECDQGQMNQLEKGCKDDSNRRLLSFQLISMINQMRNMSKIKKNVI